MGDGCEKWETPGLIDKPQGAQFVILCFRRVPPLRQLYSPNFHIARAKADSIIKVHYGWTHMDRTLMQYIYR